MRVPFLDLKAQFPQIKTEVQERFSDIMASSGFILGKHVQEFEERFAGIQEVKYCVGVSSGTGALHIALMALGVGAGDLVVVPAHTFIATSEAVSLCGATAVFVDCDEYYNMDPVKLDELLRGKLKESKGRAHRIKAIIPVHLYGQPVNMDEIMAIAYKYDLHVIEDACQAHLARWKGTRVGNFGKFGAFSFYPGKNLGAFGEAGALATNDEALYRKAKMLRAHGEVERYHHQYVGHNYRMAAFQGAVLSTKCKYIEEWTLKRRQNAAIYTSILSGIPGVETPMEREGVESVYHLYVIQVENRDRLQAYLQENGIDTGLHYPIPLHLQEAYEEMGYQLGDFIVAERVSKRILSLPMYPELQKEQIQYVCDKIMAFVMEKKG